MSSLRRISSSRANGALSRGPVTLEGKQRSAMNALSHGLLARTTLMRREWADGLKEVFNQYVDRLAPVDAVECGYVEEMVAACWRLRRLWAIETRTLENEADAQAAGDPLDRIAAAFAQLAEKPHPDLLHRYELRMHLTYQRALHNLILLRSAGTNEPSPIFGHSAPQPTVAPSPSDEPLPDPPLEPPPPSVEQAVLPPVLQSRARQQAVVSSAPGQPGPRAPEPPPVEQAVLPATPAVVTADGDCRGPHPEIPKEPSPISGHSGDPSPVVVPSPSDAPVPNPIFPSRARQQAVAPSPCRPVSSSRARQQAVALIAPSFGMEQGLFAGGAQPPCQGPAGVRLRETALNTSFP